MKDRGSPKETRENHGVTSNMRNMSMSSIPCIAETGSAASRSQSKSQKIVRPDQLEDRLDQLNLAIVSQTIICTRFQTFTLSNALMLLRNFDHVGWPC